MRSIFFLLMTALLLASIQAFAGYDAAWYQDDFWSGEYPNGFSVVKRGVSVPARMQMDPAAAKSITCRLPYRAVYHPWNEARKAQFRTASRIVPLVASADVYLGDGLEERVLVKKGETIEYLMYQAEGTFSVRFQGKVYGADQGLFSSVEPYDQTQMQEDQWVRVRCLNGKNAWIFLRDLMVQNGEGETVYARGLDSWSLGFREYGKVTDLTRKDLRH